MLDGTKVYLHGVIDNYFRKILGWQVSSKFKIQNSTNVLLQATGHIKSLSEKPILFTDGVVENYNSEVDALIKSGLLSRVLAQVEITYSTRRSNRGGER